jgi:hypothetical protein
LQNCDGRVEPRLLQFINHYGSMNLRVAAKDNGWVLNSLAWRNPVGFLVQY